MKDSLTDKQRRQLTLAQTTVEDQREAAVAWEGKGEEDLLVIRPPGGRHPHEAEEECVFAHPSTCRGRQGCVERKKRQGKFLSFCFFK